MGSSVRDLVTVVSTQLKILSNTAQDCTLVEELEGFQLFVLGGMLFCTASVQISKLGKLAPLACMLAAVCMINFKTFLQPKLLFCRRR